MDKFWRWVRNKAPDSDHPDATKEERTLFLDGTIASESWFDDDVTPALFKQELESGSGDVVLWINSPGGDCFAAASIYNMLRDYKGRVTVRIDGIAASAASVIAMAGDEVQVSPVSMIMIHNPATVAMGDHNDMQKAIEMLDSVKDSIINAYQVKTGLSRNKLATLMEEETWMDARKAVELHFADSVISRNDLYSRTVEEGKDTGQGQQGAPGSGDDSGAGEGSDSPSGKDSEDPKLSENLPSEKKDRALNQREPMLFCRKLAEQAVVNKVEEHCRRADPEQKVPEKRGYRVDDCMARLDLMKRFM